MEMWKWHDGQMKPDPKFWSTKRILDMLEIIGPLDSGRWIPVEFGRHLESILDKRIEAKN